MAPSHYLNQCRLIVKSVRRNNLHFTSYLTLNHYKLLRYTFKEDKTIPISHTLYHGCWWPGNARWSGSASKSMILVHIIVEWVDFFSSNKFWHQLCIIVLSMYLDMIIFAGGDVGQSELPAARRPGCGGYHSPFGIHVAASLWTTPYWDGAGWTGGKLKIS